MTVGAQSNEQCANRNLAVRAEVQVYPDTPPPAYRVSSRSFHSSDSVQTGQYSASTQQIRNHNFVVANTICELSASNSGCVSTPANPAGVSVNRIDRRHLSKAHTVDSRLGILETTSAKSYQHNINQMPSISVIETNCVSVNGCPSGVQNVYALPASSPDIVTGLHLEDSFVALHQSSSILDRSFQADESTDDSLDSVD